MEPISLIIALALGLGGAALGKHLSDKALKKYPAFARLNEQVKEVLVNHEAEIRATLEKTFKRGTVDKLFALFRKDHLTKEDIDHLKNEDPKLYSQFLEIVQCYSPEISVSVDDAKSEDS